MERLLVHDEESVSFKNIQGLNLKRKRFLLGITVMMQIRQQAWGYRHITRILCEVDSFYLVVITEIGHIIFLLFYNDVIMNYIVYRQNTSTLSPALRTVELSASLSRLSAS